MEDPHGPVEVAWYSSLAQADRPGNVVLAGHRDYAGFGPAVFWRLRELAPGDELRLTLTGGTSVIYRVTGVASYGAGNAPVSDIVGQTATQTLTLLTCEGAFDSKTRQYDKRFVVKATRV
jgi:LPXTG-site transpeptidase (sortase) family protein